jgi:hypothetical protein
MVIAPLLRYVVILPILNHTGVGGSVGLQALVWHAFSLCDQLRVQRCCRSCWVAVNEWCR